MQPARRLPAIGDNAEIVYFGLRETAVVTAVDGFRLDAVTPSGESHALELNRVTAHFVRVGEPYWGTRLVLGQR